jgi:hypothetical protein
LTANAIQCDRLTIGGVILSEAKDLLLSLNLQKKQRKGQQQVLRFAQDDRSSSRLSLRLRTFAADAMLD